MKHYDEQIAIAKAEFEKYDSDPKVKEAMLFDRIASLRIDLDKQLVLVLGLLVGLALVFMLGRSVGEIQGYLDAMQRVANTAPQMLPVFFNTGV